MAGWEGKTLDQARRDGHYQLNSIRNRRAVAGQILDAALAARDAAQAEFDAAAREYADLSARQQAAQQNVDYLDALPDDASPGDRLPSVRIGKNDRGAWCVWVDGNLVSDHASRDAAATAARRHTKKSPDALDGAPGRMLG